jgi:hypothetical protein
MINSMKVGLVFGLITSLCHMVWIILILAGVAQPLMDFVFWAHMIQPVYVVRSFEPLAAATLMLLTFGIGYVIGVGGGLLWNKFAGDRALHPTGERRLA